MKLHLGHVTIRLFRFDIGDSLERLSLKHGLLPFKYLSGLSGIFLDIEKCFKETMCHKIEFGVE
jgi:hypothetical protein